MTKQEKRKAYLKEYYKKAYKENPQKYSDNQQKNYYNKKDGYHRVYLLEDYNYVGVTDNVTSRFRRHAYDLGRDCTNHRILYKTKDREDALELEELLHDIGYEGKHKSNRYY
tara:strand:- start:403 stop:738 length:336 start_codon:yes stop_codon:yes gene_type:complete